MSSAAEDAEIGLASVPEPYRQPGRPSLNQTPWLRTLYRSPAARGDFLLFPHAGGSVSEYVEWLPASNDVDLVGVQYPGRGSRFNDDPVLDVATLARGIANALDDRGLRGFFGHSFGALVAFDTLRTLRRLHRELPQWLVVSAFPAPTDVPSLGYLVDLPPRALLQALEHFFGSIPRLVLENDELGELVGEYTRSDYVAMHRWTYEDQPPLDVNLVVLAGDDDDSVDRKSMGRWREQVTGTVRELTMPGGHFYLKEPRNAAEIGRLVDSLIAAR